ncbi:MAG TPA: hypothetical protein VFK33_10905 [Bacillales bacterium]|nr:hypothetical protein [Bacillales bacterium]
MNAQARAKVDRWINANFDREAITVEDWPMLPAGKRIIDREGGEMVVFYDWLREKVEYRFPDKDR